MICHTHNTIFLENPKCCSFSTKTAMVPNHVKDKGCQMTGHYSVYQVAEKHPDVWRDYFKFAIVRDPIQHKASYFYYRKYHCFDQVRIPWFEEHEIEDWAKAGFPYMSDLPHPTAHTAVPNQGHLDQLQYILGVDKIIRFENYEEEITKLHSEMGFTGDLGHKLNEIKDRPTEHSEEFVNLVKARYRSEFTILGYPL